MGDVDGDGVLDLFVNNFSEDFSTLYRGMGHGIFEDVSRASGVGPATYRTLAWGAALADLDNDGDLDLVVANGHIYPQIDRHPEIIGTAKQRNLLLENVSANGEIRFADVTDERDQGSEPKALSRGLAVGDFDNDGRLDLLVSHVDGPPSLLHNETEGGAWLTVICEDRHGATNPIGTEVRISAGGKSQWRDIAAGDSFMSTHDPRPHFGLGDVGTVDQVDVKWPDGTHSVRRDVKARQFLRIREGELGVGLGLVEARGIRPPLEPVPFVRAPLAVPLVHTPAAFKNEGVEGPEGGSLVRLPRHELEPAPIPRNHLGYGVSSERRVGAARSDDLSLVEVHLRRRAVWRLQRADAAQHRVVAHLEDAGNAHHLDAAAE